MNKRILEIQKQYPKIEAGQAEDLSGKIFGRWKVLYRTYNIGNTDKVTWVCECLCDKHTVKLVVGQSLRNGRSNSCGCLKKERIENICDQKIHKKDQEGNIVLKKCLRCQEWKPLQHFYKKSHSKDQYSAECKECESTALPHRYNAYKKGAVKRKIVWDLSKEDFYKIITQPCYYCGNYDKITFNKEQYTGIDRIDSSEGYTIDNCVPCCEMCNRMKMAYSQTVFLQHIKQIYKNLRLGEE